MANEYASVADLRSWHGVPASMGEDARLELALTGASRAVDGWCRRRFWLPSVAEQATFAAPDHQVLVMPPGRDVASTSGLVVEVDPGGDGTFEETWTRGVDFQLLDGGLGPTGESWPYNRLLALPGHVWPRRGRMELVRVTALWGWPAVPSAVKLATLLLAARYFERKNTPLGAAGFADFGVRLRSDSDVQELLVPYRRGSTVAVAA